MLRKYTVWLLTGICVLYKKDCWKNAAKFLTFHCISFFTIGLEFECFVEFKLMLDRADKARSIISSNSTKITK